MKRKVFGVISLVIAGLLGSILLLIAWAFHVPDENYPSAEVNWAVVIPIILVFFVFLAIGVLCLRWKQVVIKYEEHQKRKEQKYQERIWEGKEGFFDKICRLFSIIRQKQTEREEKKEEKRIHKEEEWQKEKEYQEKLEQERKEKQKVLIDTPILQVRQTAKLYQNKNAGAATYLALVVFLSLAVGSIAVIPFMVTKYPDYIMQIGLVLTVIFWIGFPGTIVSYQYVKYSPQCAFVVSSENIMYYITFQTHNYGKHPITKIGTIIHGWRVMEAETKLVEEREKYLNSDAFLPMVERVINEEGEPEHECILLKMNSPYIKRKGIFGMRVRFWREEEERWDTKTITRANEGYKVIRNILERRMQRYDIQKQRTIC